MPTFDAMAVADIEAVLITQGETTNALTAMDADAVGAVAADAVCTTNGANRAKEQIMRGDIAAVPKAEDASYTPGELVRLRNAQDLCHAVRT